MTSHPFSRRGVLLGLAAPGAASAAAQAPSSGADRDTYPQDRAAIFEDFAALRAHQGPAPSAARVLGRTRANDGGGGFFQLDDSDITTSDNGATVVVDARGRRYRRQHAGPIDVRWAGATCDGETDDADAVRAAAALGDIAFSAGVCSIGRDLTIPSRTVCNGGRLRPADGVTISLNGGFEAAIERVFLNATRGHGRIAFDPRFQSPGRPEWWGASANSPTFDCEPALTACVAACAITQLQACDYWIAATWKIQVTGRIVSGVNGDADGSAPITRVLLQSPTLDILQVGPDEQPTPHSTAGFVGFVHLSHLSLVRTAAPTFSETGLPLNGPAGARLQWLTSSSLEDIWSNENAAGFLIRGVVFCKLRECHAFHCVRGFMQDNSADIGLNSGNASLYYDLCGVSGGFPGATASYGLYTWGGFTDTFIDRFETSQIQYAMVFNALPPTPQYPSEDLIITNCVIDTPVVGIEINAPGASSTAVSISNSYIGIGQPGGRAAFYIHDTDGAISLTGNQVIASASAPQAVGLSLVKVRGVTASQNIYTDVAHPIVCDRASNSRISDLISAEQAELAGPAAVSLTNCSRNVIDCMVRSRTATYARGVELTGDANAYNEIRCSGLDPAAIRGGAANKLVTNGTQVTVAGRFANSNLASGIMD